MSDPKAIRIPEIVEEFPRKGLQLASSSNPASAGLDLVDIAGSAVPVPGVGQAISVLVMVVKGVTQEEVDKQNRRGFEEFTDALLKTIRDNIDLSVLKTIELDMRSIVEKLRLYVDELPDNLNAISEVELDNHGDKLARVLDAIVEVRVKLLSFGSLPYQVLQLLPSIACLEALVLEELRLYKHNAIREERRRAEAALEYVKQYPLLLNGAIEQRKNAVTPVDRDPKNANVRSRYFMRWDDTWSSKSDRRFFLPHTGRSQVAVKNRETKNKLIASRDRFLENLENETKEKFEPFERDIGGWIRKEHETRWWWDENDLKDYFTEDTWEATIRQFFARFSGILAKNFAFTTANVDVELPGQDVENLTVTEVRFIISTPDGKEHHLRRYDISHPSLKEPRLYELERDEETRVFRPVLREGSGLKLTNWWEFREGPILKFSRKSV